MRARHVHPCARAERPGAALQRRPRRRGIRRARRFRRRAAAADRGQAGAAARAARNQTREQVMLIHYDGTWQMDYGLAMLGALARQPASFVRRLIIASIEDPLQVEVHARRFAAPHASPTFVSVPFAILVRDVVHAAPLAAVATRAARDARPIALLFTGRPHGSFDGSRQAVYEQLRRMGALCVHGHDGRVSCALCAPPRAWVRRRSRVPLSVLNSKTATE